MKKETKWVILIWAVLILVLGIFFGLAILKNKPASAHVQEIQCNSQCVASECGTSVGTKEELQESYEYTDAICPFGYHYQNNGNWNERCHRDLWMPHYFSEHVAPTGCPNSFSKVGDVCRKTTYQCGQTSCNDAEVIACEEPTPEVTPIPEQPRGFSEPSAPQCTDKTPLELPKNVHVIRSGSDATVNFFTNSTNANIYYKDVDSSDWQYSARDIAVTGGYVSYTIHDLVPSVGYTFGVQAANTCAGGETVLAVVVDGPYSVTFPLSYWEWLR